MFFPCFLRSLTLPSPWGSDSTRRTRCELSRHRRERACPPRVPPPSPSRRRFPGSLRRPRGAQARVSGAPFSPPPRRRFPGSLRRPRGAPPQARVSGLQSPRLPRLAGSSLAGLLGRGCRPSPANPLPSSSIFQLNPLGPPSCRRNSLVSLTARRCSGLLSFRMDWLDLLSVQGTPRVFAKSLLQWFFQWSCMALRVGL